MSEAKIACSACRTRLLGSDHPSEGESPAVPDAGRRSGSVSGDRTRSSRARPCSVARRGGRMGGRHPGPPRARQPGSGPGAGSGEPSARPLVAEAKPVAPPVVLGERRRSPAEVHAIVSRAGLGRELFLREWMPDDSRSHGGDGLGPVFNDSSCVACHNLGGVGGGGPNGKNVDILSLADVDTPKSTRATGRRPGRAKDDPAEKIHPGFRTARSVVLHRFGNSPEYAPWRLVRLGLSGGEHACARGQAISWTVPPRSWRTWTSSGPGCRRGSPPFEAWAEWAWASYDPGHDPCGSQPAEHDRAVRRGPDRLHPRPRPRSGGRATLPRVPTHPGASRPIG